MKRSLPPLLTLAISAQMMVSPYAYAIGGMNTLQTVNMVGQMLQQNQQAIQAQTQAQANQQLVAQMTQPGPDKYFKPALFATVPGLNAAAFNCATLPTTLTEIRAEVCRIGVTNDRGVPPQAQLAEMYSLYKTYGDVAKAYENYGSKGNDAGRAFGVTCMRDAMNTLNGYLTTQINGLDKMMQDITFINDRFKEQSRIDLDAIAEATAVLDGGNSELADEVRTKRPDLFDFGKRFNNPACKSMFEGDKINTIGRRSQGGGLNGISREAKNLFSAKSGKFSGESYVGAHATVVEDINKMADNVAKQFNLGFSSIVDDEAGYDRFLGSVAGRVSSSSGVNSLLNNSFFADAQQSYNEENSKLAADVRMLQDELRAAGVQPDRAMGVARNLNAQNFESEVTLVQNQLRNGCLQRTFGGQGFWDQIKRNIVDPDASKFANKNAFNSIRERIESIMTDPRTTPEAKIEALQRLERGEGSRFILNMQGSYQKTVMIDGKAVQRTVNPSSSAPSTYFRDVVSTCDAQFSTNKLGSTLTAASAIQKLRNLNQQYKSLAQNQAGKLREEIRRKLISCDTQTEANNQQAGSCTPERFNTNTPGFCANAAFTCANNMKACTAQAEQFVNQIKGERNLRVNKYKQNMEKNKNDIKNIAARVFRDYSQIGQSLAALNLGAGFNFPSPDLNVQGEYLDKFRAATQNSPDGALLLEDPDKYVEMLRKNADKMKQAFTQMQQQLTGRGGLLAQHIEQTERNYVEAKNKANDIARECIAKHDQFILESENQRKQLLADQQKRQNELGEKYQEFCERYSMIDTNPDEACGNLRGTIRGALEVARQSGDQERAQEAINYIGQRCRENGVNNPSAGSNTSAAVSRSAARRCDSAGQFKVNGQTATREQIEAIAQAPESPTEKLKYYCALRNMRCGTSASTQSGTGTTATVTSTNCDGINDSIMAVNLPNSSDSVVVSESDRVAASDTGGAPAFCDGGYNGDRNDGSLMNREGQQRAILGAFGLTVPQ